MANKSHYDVAMVTQRNERNKATSATGKELELPSNHSHLSNRTCKLLVEQQQSVPPGSERKRFVQVLFEKNKIETVAYKNNA
jgi:hypothetical protein